MLSFDMKSVLWQTNYERMKDDKKEMEEQC